MRREGTDHLGWHRVARSKQTVTTLPSGIIVDFRVLEMVGSTTGTLMGQPLTVLESGSRWISYVPMKARHVLLVMLDRAGRPVQLYVDVGERTGLGGDGFPWIDDLYLDVTATCAVQPDGRWQVTATEIIDQDELETALAAQKITRGQVDLAWAEAQTVEAALQEQRFEPAKIIRAYLGDPYTGSHRLNPV